MSRLRPGRLIFAAGRPSPRLVTTRVDSLRVDTGPAGELFDDDVENQLGELFSSSPSARAISRSPVRTEAASGASHGINTGEHDGPG